MIAYRMVHAQEAPQFQDIPKTIAGSGQLLIKVGGCGLCHTDLGTVRHRTTDDWADTAPPFTTLTPEGWRITSAVNTVEGTSNGKRSNQTN
jgi:threonine dehydrogenase-like Zn-dependent dehydrogenase